ncbi:MAG TPA: 16S rRNA (guanine(966)-N(2))-methyltransferase RsmD [Thiotrichaceae bacterium]|nr:16S rRNA (guanine(966)-N(2))-methyltransferase RsmD [Thiotrichaceae bacterium]
MARKKQPRSQPKPAQNHQQPQQLRIIAGQWRGRKLSFAVAPGLRPTPDRVRETLFNWLQGKLQGRRCLDLFAGSGALGFEAISRGAAEVVMVESHHDAIRYLQENIGLLKAENIELQKGDAFKYLHHCQQPFDIIFIDPPFAKDYWVELLDRIREYSLLADNGLIYIEHPKSEEIAFEGFEILKKKQAGAVVSLLLTVP